MARQQSEPSAPGFCARWTLGISVNIPQTGPEKAGVPARGGVIACVPKRGGGAWRGAGSRV